MEYKNYDYGSAILAGFDYLLKNHSDVFVIGQGLWSPWYVGNSMTGLEKKYGIERVIDTPVSESACTGAAVGASLSGMRPIIVHPRMDFMLYAMDAIVNQAAKWSHMTGGQAHPSVTVRGIINRGGEQGAQHSQALHSWFAHIPGLRVVMPATPSDARNLLISSVLCDDPVVFIDDRWLYSLTEDLPPVDIKPLSLEGPKRLVKGDDVTLVGAGFSTHLCVEAEKILKNAEISAEVIDIRVLNPFDVSEIITSVTKTGRLIVVDGGWRNCGFAGEVLARVTESLPLQAMKTQPVRLTLPDAPAPTSSHLENIYYTSVSNVVDVVSKTIGVISSYQQLRKEA